MHILWIILIGFIAGVIARILAPGPNNPNGFILTTVLGIAGAFLATYLGHKDITSTIVYLNLTPELLYEASERFRKNGAAALQKTGGSL